jgi:TetR/AcrR family transcriptional regulator, transcriptional repressor for nem operon
MSATREDILSLADRLIRTKGFNAFSYADIAGIMEIRNAAIHYHFPTKEDLGIQVINREVERMNSRKREWGNLPGDEQVKKIMESFFGNSRKGMICLTGALTSAYDTFGPNMQEKVAFMCNAILAWVTLCLEKGREEMSLHFQGKARDRALLLMSGLSSSLLLSRVLGNVVFDRMMDQFLKDLGTSPAKWVEKNDPDWLI